MKLGRSIHALAVLGALCTLGTGCGDDSGGSAGPGPNETQAIMREILDGMQRTLPASMDAARFRDPSERAAISAALSHLAGNAEVLRAHTEEDDAQMQFLARSIARDAGEVERVYAEERYDRAAYLLRRITENCVVCHSRLPSREDSRLTKGFVQQSVFDELDLAQRASLQIATRRFDEALVTLEELIASPEHPALMLGPLTDYLVVCIRVKGDYDRPLPTLRRFAERGDLWARLREDVEAWIAFLPGLRERAQADPGLPTARALLAEGRRMVDFPEDRDSLAHFVVASAILQEAINAGRMGDEQTAEAYYLLGLTEARIGRNHWVTAAPFLLETSIRLAPGADFAAEAYALLEQETYLSYEGSDFEEIPSEEREHLAELRALIDGA
jgi:hypothetical protein